MMLPALLSARSITALSFCVTWMATLCVAVEAFLTLVCAGLVGISLCALASIAQQPASATAAQMDTAWRERDAITRDVVQASSAVMMDEAIAAAPIRRTPLERTPGRVARCPLNASTDERR